MAIVSVPGGLFIPYGPSNVSVTLPSTLATAAVLDAVNEAAIMVGRMVTSDGGSHTIDTTGSSSIQYLCSSAAFADGGTSVKAGLAAVDLSNGPPPRAVNVADVITFDVSRTMTGGSGEIAAGWRTHVPTSGSKTIANGDLVAVAVQMLARGGSDNVRLGGVSMPGSSQVGGAILTLFGGGSYAPASTLPNCLVVFNDGAIGWFLGSDVYASIATRLYNSGSSPNEYGQLYTIPFPTSIIGAKVWVAPAENFDAILYSDPLGTPVAQRTVSEDANAAPIATGRSHNILFPSAYSVAAGAVVAVVIKPATGTNITSYYKTLNDASHRVTDAWGTTGYGVSRSGGSGAFANANSSLEHYYAGLILGGFDNGVGGGGGGAHFSAAFG